MLLVSAAALLGYALPASLRVTQGESAWPRGRTRSMQMVATPLDAIASPLRKFEGSASATGNPLADLPIEVELLFGAILIVGVAGLVKQSGLLSTNAPTIALGESRDDLASKAAAIQEEA